MLYPNWSRDNMPGDEAFLVLKGEEITSAVSQRFKRYPGRAKLKGFMVFMIRTCCWVCCCANPILYRVPKN